ncbi:MAG: helix-turn-helix domain-containing protein [Magnetococcales bacterium]|nr:helix-turn-helix domain-containing protein [Magnetococcales bacterium]
MLTDIVNKGKAAACKIKHANSLLKVDENGLRWTDSKTAEAFSCTKHTVANIRQRYVQLGTKAALRRKTRKKWSLSTDQTNSCGEEFTADFGRDLAIFPLNQNTALCQQCLTQAVPFIYKQQSCTTWSFSFCSPLFILRCGSGNPLLKKRV